MDFYTNVRQDAETKETYEALKAISTGEGKMFWDLDGKCIKTES